MIIGIDGNEANVDKLVGIGEYSYRLIEQFYYKFTDKHKFIVYLKSQPRFDLPSKKNWEYRVFGPKPLWTRLALPARILLNSEKLDVFFSPSHYGPVFSPVPSVISIMDMSYEYYPELFNKKDLHQLRNWTKQSANKAKLIFTISESSKKDIVNVYNIDSSKISVVYPGIKSVNEPKTNMDDLRIKFKIKNKYFLFVGTLQPRKNISRLIEAFSLVLKSSKDKDIDLVIVGKKGWLYEDILKAPSRFDVEDNVKFLDFVTDDEVKSLYKGAIAFVFPSLYEGFGLPILEAMNSGCPVITSKISSMPEAGGDAALYIDPEDVNDLSSKMSKVLESDNLRQDLIAKGHKQVKNFSWEKSAEKTLKSLEDLVNK